MLINNTVIWTAFALQIACAGDMFWKYSYIQTTLVQLQCLTVALTMLYNCQLCLKYCVMFTACWLGLFAAFGCLLQSSCLISGWRGRN